MFAMTSMGEKVDRTVNDGNGPYVFRLNGQNHHLIGSLLPVEGSKPKFAQLYIFDTEDKVQHRIRSISSDKENYGIDPEIVNSLIHMLDEKNALVKVFKMARDRYTECNIADVRLCLINCRTNHSSQYNLPTTSEVAGLIVDDFDLNNGYRDIIVEDRDRELRCISEIHLAFMAMQYPLLFPYGEDGFSLAILKRLRGSMHESENSTVIMREYYAFCIQQ